MLYPDSDYPRPRRVTDKRDIQRLRAAAPEMLAVLEHARIVNYMDRAAWQAFLERVQDVIDKAEGRGES